MNLFEQISTSELAWRIGWTLLHSVWQLILVAFGTKVALSFIATRNSGSRYAISCASVLVAMATLGTTFCLVSKPESTPIPATAQTATTLLDRNTTLGPDAEEEDSLIAKSTNVAIDNPSVDPDGPNASTDQFGTDPARSESAVIARELSGSIQPVLSALIPWLVVGWILGVVLFSLRPVFGWWHIFRLRGSADYDVGDRLLAIVRALSQVMGIQTTIQVANSGLVHVPTVIGFLKPLILLPASSLTNLSSNQLEAILLHELAHIRRRDFVVNLIQIAFETLLFFHPAAWWISSMVRNERENCCDDLAVDVGGSSRDLAQALFQLEKLKPAPAQSFAASGGQLSARIRRLVVEKSKASDSAGGIWFDSFVSTAIIALVLGLMFRPNDAIASNTFPKFDRMVVTDARGIFEWDELVSSERDTISQFRDLFPEAGHGQRGKVSDQWDPDYRISFIESNSNKRLEITVRINEQLWSEGNGQWRLKEAAELRRLLESMRREMNVQSDDDQYEVGRATEFASVDELKKIDANKTRHLRFSGQSDVTDEVVTVICARFLELRILELDECRSVTDDAFADIAKLEKLYALRFRFGEKLSADSAATLAKLKSLEVLDISYCRNLITDKAIEQIITMPQLRWLVAIRHGQGNCSSKSLKRLADMQLMKQTVISSQFPAKKGDVPSNVKVVADNPSINWFDWAVNYNRLRRIDQATSKQVELERKENEAMYKAQAAQLRKKAAGKWVVIVRGKTITTSVDSFDAAVAAADKLEPGAAHRFIYRPGIDDLDTKVTMSPWMPSDPSWWQFGRQFQIDQLLTISPSKWIRDGKSMATGARGAFGLGAPGENPGLKLAACVSGLFTDQLLLTEADAIRLRLDRFAVPGSVTVAGFDDPLRKVRCRVVIKDLGIDTQIVGYAFPQKVVDENPPQRGLGGNVLSDMEKAAQKLIESIDLNPIQDVERKKKALVDITDKWIVQGKVTDSDGKPVEDVDVRAMTGAGTLRQTGVTKTNENGEYSLPFSPGIRFGDKDGDSVGVQAATIFVSKEGYYEKDLCKAGDRLMAAKLPTGETAWGSVEKIESKLILKGKPATINFVMMPGSDITGYLVDSKGNLVSRRSVSITGPELPPSSSVLDQQSVGFGGKFVFKNVPRNKKWKFELRLPNRRGKVSTEGFFEFDTKGNIDGIDLIDRTKTNAKNELLVIVDFDAEPPKMSIKLMDEKTKAKIDVLARVARDKDPVRGSKPPADDNRDLNWGNESKGLQAAIHVLTGNEVKQGDQIEFDFVVRNVSKEIIRFESSAWREEDQIIISDKNGRRIKDISTNWYSGWPAVNVYELRPGEEVSIKSGTIGVADRDATDFKFDHPRVYCANLSPGQYKFSFKLYMPDINRFHAREGHWRGRLTTGEAEFQMK